VIERKYPDKIDQIQMEMLADNRVLLKPADKNGNIFFHASSKIDSSDISVDRKSREVGQTIIELVISKGEVSRYEVAKKYPSIIKQLQYVVLLDSRVVLKETGGLLYFGIAPAGTPLTPKGSIQK
jgi:hypothetical protein